MTTNVCLSIANAILLSVARDRDEEITRMKRFGGTQVYRWTAHECPQQIYLWYQGASAGRPTLFQSLLFRRGEQLEERYLGIVQKTASSYVDIHKTAWPFRADATLRAMADGIEVIAHPYLVAPKELGPESLGIALEGEADLLRRIGGERLPSGVFPYQVLEVKSAGKVADHHKMQLAFYVLLADAIQGRPSENGIVVTWDGGEHVENAVDIRAPRSRLEGFLQNKLAEHAANPDADYHRNSKCSDCPYDAQCEAKANEEQHLSVLPGLRRRQQAELKMAGVETWPELAISLAELAELEGRCCISAPSLRRLRAQALAQEFDTCFPRGSLRECLGGAGGHAEQVEGGRDAFSGARVYFDMETDPLEGSAYLFAYQAEEVRRTQRGAALENVLEAHCSRWGALQPPVQTMATGLTEEELFQEFLADMDRMRAEYGHICIFHYGRFEQVQLVSLAKKYASIEDVSRRVTRLLGESVDVHAALARTRCLPVASYSLKYVAPTIHRLTGGNFGHKWEGPKDKNGLREFLQGRGMGQQEVSRNMTAVERAARYWGQTVEELIAPSAGGSVLWYREFLQDPAPVWLALIERYNADDLLAARAVTHWLLDQLRLEPQKANDYRPTIEVPR